MRILTITAGLLDGRNDPELGATLIAATSSNYVIGGALLGIAGLFGQKSPLRACSSPGR